VLVSLNHAGAGLQGCLSDGTPIACDLVLSAVGLRPRTELAAAAGLQVNRGIMVDRELRSSHANIYALGDCAEVDGLNLQYVMPLMHCARALARTLAGEPSAVSYGPMPVTVKTPVCPLVVSPPPRDMPGEWTVEGSGSDIKALCRDAAGSLLGYALTGTAVQEKLALNRQLPALLA
ncbi:MAG: FAD-dependent oxidoreductase, partial [Pseudomonas sp.]|uniref:FAD-dependent oxidoreductase n=1 Tax=Pseudomonas sp. TaxID=306 RepID=UPI003BB5555E